MLNIESKSPNHHQQLFYFSFFLRYFCYFYYFLVLKSDFHVFTSSSYTGLFDAICYSFVIFLIEVFVYLPFRKHNSSTLPLFIFFPFFLIFQGLFHLNDSNIVLYLEAILFIYSFQFLNIRCSSLTTYVFLVLIFIFSHLPKYFQIYLFQFFFLYMLWDTEKIKHSFYILLSLIILCFVVCSYQLFGICDLDQVLASWQFGKAGMVTGDLELYFIFINRVIILPFVLFCFFISVRTIYQTMLLNKVSNNAFLIPLFSCSYLIYMTGTYVFLETLGVLLKSQLSIFYVGLFLLTALFIYFLRQHSLSYAGLGLFLFASIVLNMEYRFSSYLYQFFKHSSSSVDYFKKYYKDPKQVAFQVSKNPKSLILIYVESLESTYQDKKLFKQDLLHDLNALTYPKINFKHFSQVSGTSWTMAGILASQCGVPYKLLTVFNRNQQGQYLSRFIPGAWCLGDILHANAYKNIFLNGSSLQFAGQGVFFKTHHYDETYGRENWQEKGYSKQDLQFWGLADDLLFKEAKLKLNQLMKQSQPFNLTILTIDTHGIDGRLSNSCLKRGGKEFTDIVECTSNTVADFIHFVAKQGWLDKVSIVVTGDHLAMMNAAHDKLQQSNEHYIYNILITDSSFKKSRDNIVHFDLFPTILHSLGFKWDDNKLGLGYSALADTTQKLPPKKRIDKLEKIILSHSKSYNKLWF